jgi:hypothetical protein
MTITITANDYEIAELIFDMVQVTLTGLWTFAQRTRR